jgi:hypothetical protein
MSGIYYSPEQYGLTLVAELDLDDELYNFNMLAVWQDNATGKFLFVTDAGWRCPSPFEDTSVSDLAEFSWSAIDAVIVDEGRNVDAAEAAAFKQTLRKAGA